VLAFRIDDEQEIIPFRISLRMTPKGRKAVSSLCRCAGEGFSGLPDKPRSCPRLQAPAARFLISPTA
jgi:hypothetical protein